MCRFRPSSWTADFYDALERGSDDEGTFSHAATYGGHPVAAAVALRMIEIIEERDLLGHVRRVGPRLQQHLASLDGHPMVFNTRGVGLGGAVQLHSLPDAAGARGRAMQDAMMAEGLLLRVVKDTINFAPPLIITAGRGRRAVCPLHPRAGHRRTRGGARMSIPPLIAYTDRWSVRAGGRIEVKVSCSSANYRADLVRIRSADPNPAGPGLLFDRCAGQLLKEAIPGDPKRYMAGRMAWCRSVGSCCRRTGRSVRVQPWLLDGRPQAVLAGSAEKGFRCT